jgi:hypothetical protein
MIIKFNKDSKIIRVSAYAEGYYSKATAYGELYIPYEFYQEHIEKIEELTCYVGELDGKYSEVECDIKFEEVSIFEIMKMEYAPYEQDKNIDESVFFRVCSLLKLNDEQSEIINNFSNAVLRLEKLSETESFAIILTKDTIIENTKVPKNTIIKYEICNEKELSEDWEWQFNWNIKLGE